MIATPFLYTFPSARRASDVFLRATTPRCAHRGSLCAFSSRRSVRSVTTQRLVTCIDVCRVQDCHGAITARAFSIDAHSSIQTEWSKATFGAAMRRRRERSRVRHQRASSFTRV